jgi:biopolymer transport protein ExbB/TolQ
VTDKTKDTRFFEAINQSALAINQATAGAGVIGLIGFVLLFALATVFFITETFFVAMGFLSLALLVYVSGSEVAKLLRSSFTTFFSSKHLTPKAAQLQEALVAMQDRLQIRRDRHGELKVGPIEKGARLVLPDNALVRDVKALLEKKKDSDYGEYIAHSYYVECHELYDHSSTHLDFVSGCMPLFGLMGTVLGLMQMFDSMGSAVSIEALAPQLALAFKTTLYGALYSAIYKILGTRFDQRLKALDYDFETFCRGLQVLIDNEAVIEVQR